MRCRFLKLTYCQLKRALRLLPATLTAAAFLCVAIGVFLGTVTTHHGESEQNSLFEVAYVGEISDYMGMNVDKAARLVGEEFGVGFSSMTEEEASRAMLKGDLTTYVIFPDGFVEAVDDGSNDKRVTYVTAEGKGGVAGKILAESLDGISSIMTTTQCTYYSAYDYLRLVSRNDFISEGMDILDKGMISSVLGAISSADVELIGVSNGLSFNGYYLVAVLMIFITLSGIGASFFFSGRNVNFELMLKREGENPAIQVLTEFIGFSALQTLAMFLLSVLMMIGVSIGKISISELGSAPGRNLFLFVLSVWPYAMMLFMMQFMLYEIFRGTIGAILSQFAVSVILGLVSGFYYPLSMLPERVARVSSFLPTGAAFNGASASLLHSSGLKEPLLCLAWTILFFGVSAFVRDRRLEKDL
ncbi:MAG: ABC transporter permease [Lachnospiraceae bacterium]|nr:ABC transporter permease [Lachnospiraceae bacterium]